jgi:magnesium transporter
MMVAGISGVLVPLGFRALKIDPALGSAVAVTTATDVIGFFIYLGLATLMITLIVSG